MRFQTMLLLPVLLFCPGCSPAPHADVDIRQKDSDIVFQFRTRGVNGLLSLVLWQADTKEVLWNVNLNYYQEQSLRYGEVPDHFTTFNGAQNHATQNIPLEGRRPPPIAPNQKFYLTLDYQYDRLLGASFTTVWFSFLTDREGRISHVARVEHITANDFPNAR